MNIIEILILAAILWLARELRQLRRDNGQQEIALADLHLEARGRFMVLESMLSRQPVGDGDRALITRTVESDVLEATLPAGDPRLN